MEVAPTRFGEGQALEEQVHEPGLAAAHAAPEVQTALRLPHGAADQAAEPAAEGGRMSFVRRDESLAQLVELCDGRQLRRVGLETAIGEPLQVKVAKAGARRGGVAWSRVGLSYPRLLAVATFSRCLVHVAHDEGQ